LGPARALDDLAEVSADPLPERVPSRSLAPAFGLLDSKEHEDGQKRRQNADDEHQAPGFADDFRPGEASEHNARNRRRDIADGRQGLEQSKRKRPGSIGHHLGYQRNADCKYSADAEPGQEAIGRELREASCKSAETRKD